MNQEIKIEKENQKIDDLEKKKQQFKELGYIRFSNFFSKSFLRKPQDWMNLISRERTLSWKNEQFA